MDHAGLALARAVKALAAEGAPVLICCGGGLNGGDGLAAARHLECAGYAVRVLLVTPRESLRSEPAVFAGIVERLALPLAVCLSPDALQGQRSWFQEAVIIVDALLGIGFHGVVREPIRACIEAINRSGKPVVSADLPSGLDAETGEAHGGAVKATVTVTFGLPKLGCARGDGPAQTGRLVIEPITFPRTLLEGTPAS